MDLPGPVAHLWAWFWRLDRSRAGGMGPQATTHQEIAAWAGLYGEAPRPWEVDALMEMDVARRVALSPPADGRDTGLRRTVSADDVDAAKAMFDGFGRVRDE